MTFTISHVQQQTPEWFQQRLGRVTGSHASDVLATIKSGEAASRRNYRWQLVIERTTQTPYANGYVNDAMQWGIDHEADAFAAYEAQGPLVRRTGFLSATDMMVGCSLDGDIDNFTGILECKCPLSSTHGAYILAGKVPADHLPQITHNLWVSGAQWCDFVSYDPRFPEAGRLFVVRVPRDEKAIASYALAVQLFLSEVERDEAELRKKMEAKR